MRIPSILLDCLGFIGRVNDDDSFKALGTVFLIDTPCESTTIRRRYLVSAKHTIDAIHRVSPRYAVRVNAQSGQPIVVPGGVGRPTWHDHQDPSVDLMVTPVGDVANTRSKTLPAELSYPREWAEPAGDTPSFNRLDLGDQTFATGLFSKLMNESQNEPIVRVGHIARMDGEPVRVKGVRLPMNAYLVEMLSLGGLSGSPVYARASMASGNLVHPRTRQSGMMLDGGITLLGIVSGHWDEDGVGLPSTDSATPGAIPESINTGVAVITPAYRLRELLDQPLLVAERAEFAAARAGGMPAPPQARPAE